MRSRAINHSVCTISKNLAVFEILILIFLVTEVSDGSNVVSLTFLQQVEMIYENSFFLNQNPIMWEL